MTRRLSIAPPASAGHYRRLDGRGRALPAGGPARPGRPQAVAGQPVRPCGDGRAAAALPVDDGSARTIGDDWVARFAAGLAEDQVTSASLCLAAIGRDLGAGGLSLTAIGEVAAARDPPQRRAARRPGLGQRHDWRRLSRAPRVCAARFRPRRSRAAALVAPFPAARAAHRARPRLAGIAHALSMFPTVSSPISAISARRRGSRVRAPLVAIVIGRSTWSWPNPILLTHLAVRRRRLRAVVRRPCGGDRRDRAPVRRLGPPITEIGAIETGPEACA